MNRSQGTTQSQGKVETIMGDKKAMFLEGFYGKNMFVFQSIPSLRLHFKDCGEFSCLFTTTYVHHITTN